MLYASPTKKAFTLIEMLIVIVIIGILAGILIPRLQQTQERTRDAARITSIRDISSAINVYAQDHGGEFPLDIFHLDLNAVIGIPQLTYSQTDNPGDQSMVQKVKAISNEVLISTTSTIQNILQPYLKAMPSDPHPTKGVGALQDGSCIVDGNSFGYKSNGKMFAITANAEAKRGNTTACEGTLDANNDGAFHVMGEGLRMVSAFDPENDDPVERCINALTDADLQALNALGNYYLSHITTMTREDWCEKRYYFLAWDGKNLTTLPNALSKLTNDTIEGIYLRNNNLSSLPDLSKLPNVRVIDVGNNNFSTLPNPAQLPPNLEQIRIYDNNFSTEPDVSDYRNTNGDLITVRFIAPAT